ncbi:MAG: DegT/DnrJ/EryC1/StrS family aminotransferase [Coriobacteriales bacterium]|jgi:dTDP-4-amino-4,6-dideoxygalactose transaminase|nr:DegT/DnrJ/EryC1/StrS family aminotransferase [Coriobacteriales bacterium]
MRVEFSPPDITEAEVQAVASALRSGWITTGPRVDEFEQALASWCATPRVACFNSATAALECALHLLGIGPGDEVITSAYTYTASASVICHVGATPVLADTTPGSYQIDYDALAGLVTERTKAIIPVDIAGVMCDYDALFARLSAVAGRFAPAPGTLQEAFDRPVILADGAHSFGASYKGKPSGSVADFTAFSFHAVKNLTTAEGGALTWRAREGLDSEALYRQLRLLALHGQDKDALAKSRPGAWEYDIIAPLYKCNMTDIAAALGLAQLERYPGLLARRRVILERYTAGLASAGVEVLQHYTEMGTSSGHLCLVRLTGRGEDFRNRLIEAMAARGVACNVHYKPLPLLTAYRRLGFAIEDFPHAFAQYHNEVTLPLHTKLSDDEVDYVIDSFCRSYQECAEQEYAKQERAKADV